MGNHSVSVSKVVAAPPEAVFEVLADPAKHPQIDGSGTVRDTTTAPNRLTLGAKFGMSMKAGMPYRIQNTVVEFEEGRHIAWRHFGHHVWRYELEPEGRGTKVTETFDWSGARSRKFIELMRYPEKNKQNMEKTLDRLAEAVTAR